jgi:hypothetical protein
VNFMSVPGASVAPTILPTRGLGDASGDLTTGQKFGLGVMAALVLIGVIGGVAR